MTSILRILILAVTGLIFAVLIGMGFLLAGFKPEDYRQRLEAALGNAMGRECRIKGKIETAFFPSFTLRANDIIVEDTGPYRGSPFCTIQELGFGLPLNVIFGSEPTIEELRLDKAVLHLKKVEDGQGNWTYGFGNANGKTSTQSAVTGVTLQPRRILCNDLRVVYREEQRDSAYSAVFKTLELQGAGENREIPFELTGEIQDHNSPRRVQVSLGGFSRFSWSEGVSLMLSSMKIAAQGFSEEDKNIDATGKISWSFLQKRMKFEDFSGRFSGSPFRGNATLTVPGGREPAELTGYLHVDSLDFDVVAEGLRSTAPARDAGIVRGAPNLVRPTVHGTSQGRPPALSIPGMTHYSGGDSPSGAAATAGKGSEFDCLPDPSRLKTEFTLSAGNLRLKGLPFRRARVTVNSPDDKIQLQYSADLYGAAVAGQADVDVLCKDIAFSTSMSLSNGIMEELSVDLEQEWGMTGSFNASLELSGAGNSFSSVVHSLEGKFSVEAKDGAVHNFSLIPTDLPRINPPPPILPYDRLSATANIKDGVATTRDITFTAPMLTGKGGGTLLFAQGQVDIGMDFLPDGKRPSVPVFIRGPYNALASGVDMRLFRRNVRETWEPPKRVEEPEMPFF